MSPIVHTGMSVKRNVSAALATVVTCGVLLVGGGYVYKHLPKSHRNDAVQQRDVAPGRRRPG